MSRSPLDYAQEAEAHLAAIRRHISRADLDDETVADAVSMRLAAAIESLSHLTDSIRAEAFGSTWVLMWATRNRIAHGYAFIDRAIIQETVDEDLPQVQAALEELLRKLGAT